MSITVKDVLSRLGTTKLRRLSPPTYYLAHDGPKIALAVESCQRHVTDEAWQIMAGLESAGYTLFGHGLPNGETDVDKIVSTHHPQTIIVQDRREWDVHPTSWRDKRAMFSHVDAIKGSGAFCVMPVKDVHCCPTTYSAFSDRIGVHAWIVHYHPDIVLKLSPYMRPEHVVRTYHSVDPDLVPAYSEVDRHGAVLSGFVSNVYPWRRRLAATVDALPYVAYLRHPGYKLGDCATPTFLQILTRFKVAICTCSVYGYAVRKIVEASACGCVVLTDLPEDDVLPEIDGNLVRVSPDIGLAEMTEVLNRMYDEYDSDRQWQFAERAKTCYDYRTLCNKLALDIERMRYGYTS